jgi:tetratricopeptide (TPR) repeat protein
MALLSKYNGKFSDAVKSLLESTLIHKRLGNSISELRDRLFLALAFKAKGQTTEFNKELDKASELLNTEGIEPWWLFLYGKISIRKGEVKKAGDILNKISNKINEGNRSDNAAFNILKAEIELENGNHIEAKELFETGINLRNDAYTLESLANFYYETGDLNMAISKYQEIIKLKSLGWEAQEYWILAHYKLAKIFEQKGDKEQAIKYYEDFLNIWKDADEDLPDLIDAKTSLNRL